MAMEWSNFHSAVFSFELALVSSPVHGSCRPRLGNSSKSACPMLLHAVICFHQRMCVLYLFGETRCDIRSSALIPTSLFRTNRRSREGLEKDKKVEVRSKYDFKVYKLCLFFLAYSELWGCFDIFWCFVAGALSYYLAHWPSRSWTWKGRGGGSWNMSQETDLQRMGFLELLHVASLPACLSIPTNRLELSTIISSIFWPMVFCRSCSVSVHAEPELYQAGNHKWPPAFWRAWHEISCRLAAWHSREPPPGRV